MSTAETAAPRGFNFKRFMADQLRNIAPVFTLVALVVFFSFASSSFLSLDNMLNIIRQLSITGIIAVGLTYVILTAEIDLSVAAVANAVGITVAYFTIQPDYVNIANAVPPCRAASPSSWHLPRPLPLALSRPAA